MLRQMEYQHHPAVRGSCVWDLASSQGAGLILPSQQAKLWLSDCSLLLFSRSAQKTVLGITPTTSTWTV